MRCGCIDRLLISEARGITAKPMPRACRRPPCIVPVSSGKSPTASAAQAIKLRVHDADAVVALFRHFSPLKGLLSGPETMLLYQACIMSHDIWGSSCDIKSTIIDKQFDK